MPTVFSNPALVPAIVVDSIAMEDVVGLSAALASKAASVHTHEQSHVTGLIDSLAGKAASVHTHEQSQVTGLVDALADKAALEHTHTQAQVDGLSIALAGMMLAPITRSFGEGRPLDDAAGTSYQVAGVLSPDVTPYLLQTAGLQKWSSNGSLTPAPSGMYVLMESIMFTDTFRILVYQDGVYTGKSFVSFPMGVGPGLPSATPANVTWGASTTGGATGVPVVTLAPAGGTPAGVVGRLCIVDASPSPEIWQCIRLNPVLWKKVAQAADVMGI